MVQHTVIAACFFPTNHACMHVHDVSIVTYNMVTSNELLLDYLFIVLVQHSTHARGSAAQQLVRLPTLHYTTVHYTPT